MRTLIDRIVLTPVSREGKETLSITLHGDLAGILGLAAKAKGPLEASDPVVECTKLVAGARNHLSRTVMAWTQPRPTGVLGGQSGPAMRRPSIGSS